MIESLKLKFESGNGVPVDRAVITRDEYEQMMEMEKDAERYRWMRDSDQDDLEVFFATDENCTGWGSWYGHDDKDAAIDTAMSRDREG